MNEPGRRWLLAGLIGCAGALGLAPARLEAATIELVIFDAAGEGFNDPSPVSPVGGNDGTTLGEQRRNALRFAADLWAAQIDSPVAIRVAVRFDPLGCDANSVTLGVAGPVSVFTDFAGTPRADTWYPSALANKLAGRDLDPQEDDIEATFNSVFGTSCAFPADWYYGLDRAAAGEDSDFVTVALHELGHGLGFLTFIDVENGRRLDDRDDAFMQFLFDNRTGKTFVEMSNAERASASLATTDLRWNGPMVAAESGSVTVGVDESGRVEMFAPPTAQVGSSVSHWSDEVQPLELLAPFFENPLHDVGLALQALADIGWAVAPLGCQADCNQDGTVTIDELIVAVRIALGDAALTLCAAADADGDGSVEVNELVGAVGSALNGCTS